MRKIEILLFVAIAVLSSCANNGLIQRKNLKSHATYNKSVNSKGCYGNSGNKSSKPIPSFIEK